MDRCIKFYTADAIPPCKTMVGDGVIKSQRPQRIYQICATCRDLEEAKFWLDKLCAYREGAFVLVVEFVPTSRWDEIVFTPQCIPAEWMEKVLCDMQVFLNK